jgi:hypothetical protein
MLGASAEVAQQPVGAHVGHPRCRILGQILLKACRTTSKSDGLNALGVEEFSAKRVLATS